MVLSGPVAGQGQGSPGARDAAAAVRPLPTHAELREKRGANRIDGKIDLVEEPKPLQKIRSERTESLLERSVILAYRGDWTLVPKAAVLHVPLNLKSRVGQPADGNLLSWTQFLAKNRIWLRDQPVTMGQARGDTPMTPEEIKKYKAIGQVVVATCHGGPISVVPPKKSDAVAGG